MMSRTILIIEDDRRIAEWVKIYFERSGFLAEIAHDGQIGLKRTRVLNPDLIVLDLMLPSMDGMEVCRILRMESDVPIIMLTARGGQPDRVNGLECGADDYIVKPFDPEELVARAKAVLRRYHGRVQPTLSCGNLTLDESTRQVRLENQQIDLSQAQFAVLAALMRHPNQVLSRAQLITLAFNNDFERSDRAIDTHIRRLRKIIHQDDYQPIQTVYGAGYKFVCEEK
jgi:DNA-binding response OmpR family regulator